MSNQVKSKQRVAEHGEVFAAEREVNDLYEIDCDKICLSVPKKKTGLLLKKKYLFTFLGKRIFRSEY